MAVHTDDSFKLVLFCGYVALQPEFLTTNHLSRHWPNSKMVLVAGGFLIDVVRKK